MQTAFEREFMRRATINPYRPIMGAVVRAETVGALVQGRVLTQNFSENKNQNHSDVETRLLGSSADTCITDDTDGKAIHPDISPDRHGVILGSRLTQRPDRPDRRRDRHPAG